MDEGQNNMYAEERKHVMQTAFFKTGPIERLWQCAINKVSGQRKKCGERSV